MVDSDMATFVLEAVYYRVGKYILERVETTKGKLDENTILEDETVQQLLDNLMDILTAGMQGHSKALW